MPRISTSKYNKRIDSEIRSNIGGALDELAIVAGIDIKTMQTTPPYSLVLGKITSQKIAAELKKMIDLGLVVKSAAKGKTMKYMLRSQYEELFEQGKMTATKFGYGDYRDKEESKRICERIALSASRVKYEEMW